jgi:hypothetical protein
MVVVVQDIFILSGVLVQNILCVLLSYLGEAVATKMTHGTEFSKGFSSSNSGIREAAIFHRIRYNNQIRFMLFAEGCIIIRYSIYAFYL